MQLIHATLRPAKVIEVLDRGRVKVEAPGLFSAEDKDKLPPVYPFISYGCNSFSAVRENDEVWVLSLDNDPLALHWIRKDSMADNNDGIMGQKDVEILCNRTVGSNQVAVYYTNDGGWTLVNGSSSVVVQPDKVTITNSSSSRIIEVSDASISLGKSGSSDHTACFGDKTVELANLIHDALQAAADAAKSNAFTMPVAAALTPFLPQIQNAIPPIESQNVTLD